MNNALTELLSERKSLYIQQIKEWTEIIINFETKNKYEVLDENGNKLGFIAESGGGLFTHIIRQVLNTHRPMEIKVWDAHQKEILHLKRPFYWIWSDLTISSDNKTIGHVKRRFALIHKLYDLEDSNGKVFAQIKAPFWNLWTFPVLSIQGQEVGSISKSWGGFLKEVFTDADKFQVNLPTTSTIEEKAIILAAAISVDLDYFEENSSQS